MRVAIIGAGLSGSTIARVLADNGHGVAVFEKADDVGGHVSDTYVNGTIVSKFGPHTFHTSDPEVWEFVNRFAEWRTDFKLLTVSVTDKGVAPWPVNLKSLEVVYGGKGDIARERWQRDVAWTCTELASAPDTFETRARRVAGTELFDLMFRGYTEKQWRVPASEVPPEVFTRIRMKEDYDPYFFGDTFEGQPKEGYSELVRRMLDHPNIKVQCGIEFDWFETRYVAAQNEIDLVISTAPPDRLTNNLFGKLDYLSVAFEPHHGLDHVPNIVQRKELGEAHVVNFASRITPATRWTFYHRMYPSDGSMLAMEELPGFGEELYPVRTNENAHRAQLYIDYLRRLNILSAGRLGSYQYFDMWLAVRKALDLAYNIVNGNV